MSGDEPLAPLTWSRALTSWGFVPLLTLLVLAAAGIYLWATVRATRHGTPWHRGYTASFLLGLTLVAVTVQSFVGVYSDALFWVHMIGHLMLIMVAPIFLAAGKPLELAVRATTGTTRTRIERTLVGQPVAAITNPLVAAVLYTLVIVGTHLTGFMDLMPAHPAIRWAEVALYVGVGYLFFMPLVTVEPVRWRLAFPAKAGLLALSMPVDTFVGLLLMLQQHNLWPGYMAMRPDWALAPLDDLHAGGAIMWVGGDTLMLIALLVLFSIWAFRTAQVDGAGRWLESARSDRLRETTGFVAGAGGIDDDQDDRALAAYNAWLGRLQHSPEE